MAGLSGVPIIILKEGSKRDTGKDAQRRNILAAKAVAEAVRTTLGPKGMDKMLIDGSGDATITNDGATILREMDIENPVAKMIVEVAKGAGRRDWRRHHHRGDNRRQAFGKG